MQKQAGGARLGAADGGAADVSDTPAAPPRALGRDAVAMLAEIPLFATLSRRHLGKIARIATTKRYAAGSPLVRAGGPATAFFVILSGSARVDTPEGGVELEMGDFFGEMAVIDGEPRSATVVAVSEVWVMVISRTKFLAVLAAEPKIALAVMATLTRRLRVAQRADTL
jgi:CRP/FNR family cyclic AMP-dependent transcriptional regulator